MLQKSECRFRSRFAARSQTQQTGYTTLLKAAPSDQATVVGRVGDRLNMQKLSCETGLQVIYGYTMGLSKANSVQV